MREPPFWWRKAALAAGLLAPAAAGYGAIAKRRMAREGQQVGVPVLCVGNFTHGGAGKTPTVLWLASWLQQAGERVFCLSRGYGGSLAGPKLVDVNADGAALVGDEALLLARVAPTIVARDRVAGAEVAVLAGASIIVMDDGLQNPSLAKDFTLAAVDARRGIGNGRVFPAGPLRAPLAAQLARADALLVVGEGDGARAIATALPVFRGRLLPDPAVTADLKTHQVFAFAGIGDVDKFFKTVNDAGITIAQRRTFPDHHRYTAEEAAALIRQAEAGGLTLLTTAKDRARMIGEPALAALAEKTRVLPVTLAVEEADDLRRQVRAKLRR